MVQGNELADSQGNQAAMQRPVFPSKVLCGIDLRKGTVIFAIHRRSFGKFIITRHPLAAAHAIAGVEQTIRLYGLQGFGFILCLVLLLLPLKRKEDRQICTRCGVPLLFMVLHVVPTEWTFGGGSGTKFLSVGDEEILCTCQDQTLEDCVLNVTSIKTLSYQFSCFII